MSVKCTREKANEDSSFPTTLELLSHPREERTSHRAHAPPPPPASCIHQTHTHIQRRPWASGRAPQRRDLGCFHWGTLRAQWETARMGWQERTRCCGVLGEGAWLLDRCDAKIHSPKIISSKPPTQKTPPRADCETMFQITKSTVFNKNNLNSFMNPFYFKSLFYCLLMLQFSSSTLY